MANEYLKSTAIDTMTTKKDLSLKSKKELVELVYDFQRFFFYLEREISHELHEDILEEIYFEALDGKIPQADFFGATRFAERFNKLAHERIVKASAYYPAAKIMNDDRFDFANWYTPIDIFRGGKA